MTCAPLRRILSHVPSPVERLGIEENAKMTAAQTRTGSQTVRSRDLAIGGDASLRPQTGERQGNPVQVRNGPAAVRGDAPAPHATGPRAGKAAREGAPSQKTSAAGTPNPSRKGGFVLRLVLLAATLAAVLSVQ